MTNFPTTLDILVNPTPLDSMATVSHSDQHADANDAIEALEAKVGVDGSAVPTSLDFRVAALEADPGVTDHGALTGLGDDDHTIYALATGARGFSGVVVGVTPVLPAHLATKGYVDTADSAHVAAADPHPGYVLESTIHASLVTPLASAPSGTGNVALNVSPQFTTPALGTPSSGVLSSCTEYPLSALTGAGTSVLALLAGNASGSGGPAGTTSPTLVTPVLGVASATSLAVNGATIGAHAIAAVGSIAAFNGIKRVTILHDGSNPYILSSSGTLIVGDATTHLSLNSLWEVRNDTGNLRAANRGYSLAFGNSSDVGICGSNGNTGVLECNNGTQGTLRAVILSKLYLNGVTDSFPMLDNSGTTLRASLAGGGGRSPWECAALTATSGTFTGLLQNTLTTEQLRLRYDASNYLSATVASSGATTFATTGTNAGFQFTPSGSGVNLFHGNIASDARIIAGSFIGFGSVSSNEGIYRIGDGVWRFTNAADNNFSMIQLGGVSASRGAIKYISGTNTIAFRTADDSADIPITCAALTATSGTFNTTLKPGSYTVAGLPAGTTGMVVYCSNLRVFDGVGTQQGAAGGTGGYVIYNGSAWKNADAQSVTAVA